VPTASGRGRQACPAGQPGRSVALTRPSRADRVGARRPGRSGGAAGGGWGHVRPSRADRLGVGPPGLSGGAAGAVGRTHASLTRWPRRGAAARPVRRCSGGRVGPSASLTCRPPRGGAARPVRRGGRGRSVALTRPSRA